MRQIVEAAGGPRALARELGISHASICRWKRVPAERVLDVARIAKLRRSEVRPDIYPPRIRAALYADLARVTNETGLEGFEAAPEVA